MTTMLGKSGFNERHQLSLGIGSYNSTAMVTDYLEQCDAIFAIGSSLTRTIFALDIPPGKQIVHATVDPRDLNKDYPADGPILGDAKLVLQQMIGQLSPHSEVSDIRAWVPMTTRKPLAAARPAELASGCRSLGRRRPLRDAPGTCAARPRAAWPCNS